MARGDTKIKDSSGDRKYFIQTPMLAWAAAEDPYELALWFVIKMIAWEGGECTLSTEDLATLAMMSTGKVSQCRSRLLDLGLLEGELRKDPEYPQPVWHLTIPDVWKENIEWAEEFRTITAKVDHKTLQRSEKQERRSAVKSLHRAKDEAQEPSPGEEGIPPGEEGIPPGEEGIPPGEEGIPPGEATNIYRDPVDPDKSFEETAREDLNSYTPSATHTAHRNGSASPPPGLAAPEEDFDPPKDKTPRVPTNGKPPRSETLDARKLIEGYIPGDEGATAVEVYHEVYSTKHVLSKTQRKAITKTVTDMALWRKAVTEWNMAGNKPGNVTGMLDWYSDPKRLPSAAHHHANGTGSTKSALLDIKFTDWLLRQYYNNMLPVVMEKTGKSEKELRDEYKQWRIRSGLPPG